MKPSQHRAFKVLWLLESRLGLPTCFVLKQSTPSLFPLLLSEGPIILCRKVVPGEYSSVPRV